MTQHPFEREFSEEEVASLNAQQEQKQSEEKQTDIDQELTDEDAEQIAGGSLTIKIRENGGGLTKARWEAGGKPTKI